MQHKTILSQGGTVHYWIARNDNVSDCIVFTHGVTADHTMFEKQIPYFSDNYTIILWDVPMHGLSKPYQKFTYQDTAEILHSILQKENIQKTFLVGMSMGGYPSQHFAALYPDMVKGFVALDTTPLGLKYYSKSDLSKLPEYQAVTIPMLAICGSKEVRDMKTSLTLLAQNPNCQTMILQGANHDFPMRNAKQLNPMLEKFISECL